MTPMPATKQRSPWVNSHAIVICGVTCRAYRRQVSDGALTAFVGEEPQGWHLSISHPRRYPRWDEITHARYALCPTDIDMVMHLPPPEEYVAIHDNCFHLHEHPARPS